MFSFKKPCTIKIWYWNYRDLNNRYGLDNKQIHFEILQDGLNPDKEKRLLFTYSIPDFINGYEMVESFMKDKYEVLRHLSKLNYNQSFVICNLNYKLITLEQGESDIRFTK